MYQLKIKIFYFLVLTSIIEIIPFSIFAQEISLQKIESLSHQTDTIGLWAKIKLAEQKIKEGKKNEALPLLSSIQDPFFDFYIKVLLGHPLITIPIEPAITPENKDSFYRELYKKALGTLIPDPDKKSWVMGINAEINPRASLPPDIKTETKCLGIKADLNWGKPEPGMPLVTREEVSKINSPCSCLLDLATWYRQTKQIEEALQTYQNILQLSCTDEPFKKGVYWTASLNKKLGKDEEAKTGFQKLLSHFPKDRLTDDAFYALWKLSDPTGKPEGSFWNALLNSSGDMRASALWEIGWKSYKNKSYDKAFQFFQKIISDTPPDEEWYPQALYWQARVLEKQNKSSIAHPLYEKILKEFPFSYYAFTSSQKLKRSFSPIIHLQIPLVSGDEVYTRGFSLVTFFSREGFHQEALAMADYAVHILTSLTPAQKAQLWFSGENYYQALLLASEATGLSPLTLRGSASEWAFYFYPHAYPQAIKHAYEKSQLPRGVIEGMMREESQFRDRVVSTAGAIGLMQLMPGTAKMVANQIGLSGFTTQNIYEPQTNLILGSWFFKDLLTRYQGSYPLAIMAYNAGPGNVDSWKKSLGQLSLEEFIEEVPFNETRGYVKRVLRSMHAYGVQIPY